MWIWFTIIILAGCAGNLYIDEEMDYKIEQHLNSYLYLHDPLLEDFEIRGCSSRWESISFARKRSQVRFLSLPQTF